MYHLEIKARDLRDGHLMRVNSSRNYVLVADARACDRGIAVTIYDGNDVPKDGPAVFLDPDKTVSLSPYGRGVDA